MDKILRGSSWWGRAPHPVVMIPLSDEEEDQGYFYGPPDEECRVVALDRRYPYWLVKRFYYWFFKRFLSVPFFESSPCDDTPSPSLFSFLSRVVVIKFKIISLFIHRLGPIVVKSTPSLSHTILSCAISMRFRVIYSSIIDCSRVFYLLEAFRA